MNPSQRIDQLITRLTDWRGKTFASIRKSILEADREIIEEWKWMGSPVWSHDGIIAVANAHKEKVKLTFAQGAKLPDPDRLFNAGLEGKVEEESAGGYSSESTQKQKDTKAIACHYLADPVRYRQGTTDEEQKCREVDQVDDALKHGRPPRSRRDHTDGEHQRQQDLLFFR